MRRQIPDIQRTVATLLALSRRGLAQTICEDLRWRSPTGGNRDAVTLGLLGRLERVGILRQTANRAPYRRPGYSVVMRSPLLAESYPPPGSAAKQH